MMPFMAKRTFDTFGKRVRVLREDLEWTQECLRKKLQLHGVNIGQSYISEIERSKKLPNGEVIIALAKALQTSADYLLMLTDDHQPRNGDNALSFTVDNAEERRVLGDLVELAQEMSPADRQLLLEIARRFRASRSRRTDSTDTAADNMRQWVAALNVLAKRFDPTGDDSFIEFVAAERPDLAAHFGIFPEQKAM